MALRFERLKIPDVVMIEAELLKDDRGFFTDIYTTTEFKANDVPCEFVQGSYTKSKINVLRGLHFQAPPHAQGKLVRVLSGKIFDVTVDLRKSSKYYGKWVSAELSEENGRMLWIPEGFAHGFLTLADDTRVLYKFTGEYSRESGSGIIWNDPDIGIEWPEQHPYLSPKDSIWLPLSKAKIDFP